MGGGTCPCRLLDAWLDFDSFTKGLCAISLQSAHLSPLYVRWACSVPMQCTLGLNTLLSSKTFQPDYAVGVVQSHSGCGR